MAKSAAFEARHGRYDAWFEKHAAAYVSELLALRTFVLIEGRGLEIGVASGCFPGPLGVQAGVDPSPRTLAYTAARGIDVFVGTAEELPFADSCFDCALLVTTLCFLDLRQKAPSEARRVTKRGGDLLIGFIDRASEIGQDYDAHKAKNVFYRDVTFHPVDEIGRMPRDAGLLAHAWRQTLTRPLAEATDFEPLRPGGARRSRGAQAQMIRWRAPSSGRIAA